MHVWLQNFDPAWLYCRLDSSIYGHLRQRLLYPGIAWHIFSAIRSCGVCQWPLRERQSDTRYLPRPSLAFWPFFRSSLTVRFRIGKEGVRVATSPGLVFRLQVSIFGDFLTFQCGDTCRIIGSVCFYSQLGISSRGFL